MEHFNYKGGYGVYVLRHLNEELVWAIDKQFQLISIYIYIYIYIIVT